MSGPLPDPFADQPDWAPRPPRPIEIVPATGRVELRGRRVLVGLPGLGWRGDLRADERVVQGSRTYVPVIPEHEWYRAEAEQVEVFAPLVPVERVWVETVGTRPSGRGRTHDTGIRLVSLDGTDAPRPPPRSSSRRGHRPTSGARRGRRGAPGPSRGDRDLLGRRRRHLRPGHAGVGVVPLGLAGAATHHPGGPGPPTLDRMRTSARLRAAQTRQPSLLR